MPESEELVAKRFLEYLRDRPTEYAIEDAPYDDEPLTPEDIAALDEAEESVRAGRLISHEELRRSLGL